MISADRASKGYASKNLFFGVLFTDLFLPCSRFTRSMTTLMTKYYFHHFLAEIIEIENKTNDGEQHYKNDSKLAR